MDGKVGTCRRNMCNDLEGADACMSAQTQPPRPARLVEIPTGSAGTEVGVVNLHLVDRSSEDAGQACTGAAGLQASVAVIATRNTAVVAVSR